MHDVTQALAYFGAYSLGILSLLGFIAYCLKQDAKTTKSNMDDMDQAIEVVQEVFPESTILSYETN